MTKHTPGPWKLQKPGNRRKHPGVAASGRRSLCAVRSPSAKRSDRARAMADARLMSAAPEMYFITKLVAAITIPDPDMPESAPLFGTKITVGDIRTALAILEKVEQ